MEAASLTPFLPTTILFSSLNDPVHEKQLKEELYSCHKNMEISMTELLRMPVMERRSYIGVHNKLSEEEKKRLDEKTRH